MVVSLNQKITLVLLVTWLPLSDLSRPQVACGQSTFLQEYSGIIRNGGTKPFFIIFSRFQGPT